MQIFKFISFLVFEKNRSDKFTPLPRPNDTPPVRTPG